MSAVNSNPLVGIQVRIPFDKIRAPHVQPAIQILITEAKETVEAIANEPGERTFENTMGRLDLLTERLDYAMALVRHLESVATYPEFREAHNAVQAEVSAFYSSVPLNAGLWRALQGYAKTGEAKQLRGIRRRFLEKTIAEFRRHGAELDEAGKKRLEEIDVELARLTTTFSQNSLDATNEFELLITGESGLAGLPESAREMARENARAKNLDGWRFTLQAPGYLAVMTYLDDARVREKVYRAYGTRASGGKYDNTALLTRILELRRARAELLGYRDHADLVLEDRMAKSGARARSFLKELTEKTVSAFRTENEELQRFRRETEGREAPPLKPWDIAYYAEKLRKARFDFNEEDLRPYFSMERVVRGLFDLVERLYGVRVVEQADAPVWDPSTRYYRLVEEDGTELGAFYADWHPRENKRGGAWMDALITGRPNGDGCETHVGLMCGNLNPPSGGKPALLTHREVETIFHEFGHLLHHLFTRVSIRSFAGTSVAWDFVELPSQILENWCWEREALELFARHYETGEPIPVELFTKMRNARTFRAANAQMRQLGFGVLDLSLHCGYSPEADGDLPGYCRRVQAGYSPAPLPNDYAMIASFSHLFAHPVGYAAGYYSYKWSEVLDADAFSRFLDDGIFSREVGLEFRRKILARGNGADPDELYRAFRGRNPDQRPLLERAGLVEPQPASRR